VLVLRAAEARRALEVHGGLGDHVVLLLLLVCGGERAAASYVAVLAATRGAPGLGLWVTAGPRPLLRAQRAQLLAKRDARHVRKRW